MSIEVHHYIHFPQPPSQKLDTILERLSTIMATQAELASELAGVTAAIQKIGAETTTLLAKIGALEAAIAAAGNTTTEVDEALAALKAQVLIVDSLVPDLELPTP